MSATAPPFADVVLSLAALLGLWMLDRVLRVAGAEDPLIRRFRFGLMAVMLVFLGRVLSGFGMGWRAVEYLGAALIPLAVLLLTEGLLRRHAPGWAKLGVAGGTGVGVIVAFFPVWMMDPGGILYLMILQIGSFLLIGGLVLTRDRAGLSAAENRAAERLALSLLVILPLGASDFLIAVFDLPLRVSGLAVLVLCWLAIGLWRGEEDAGHRAPILSIGVMFAVGLAAAATLVLTLGLDRDGAIVAGAMCLGAVLLAAVLLDGRGALRDVELPSILTRLTAVEARDPVAFFRELGDHPAVEGAVFIEEQSLADLDRATLGRLFAAWPVLRRRAPPPAESDLADLSAHLFARFDATHILLVRSEPVLLLALSLPSIAAGTRIEAELDLAQQMAALMGER